MKVRHLIAACTLIASLVGGSLVANAQSAPGMVVNTQSFTMTLSIGPAQPIIMQDQADMGLTGEVLANPAPGTMIPSLIDQGRPANHHIAVSILRKNALRPTTGELAPSIQVLNQESGQVRRWDTVLAMAPTWDQTAVHYGVNAYLPDGLYTVIVTVQSENAVFSDLMVTGGGAATAPRLPAPPAAAVASQPTSTRAIDNQTLASQPAAVQALFTAVWGSNAATEWVREHNLALSGGR